MVQNVSGNVPQNTKQKNGFFSSVGETIKIASPGAITGAMTGYLLSNLPASKTAVSEQLFDVFLSDAQNNVKSDYVKNLLNKDSCKGVKEFFKSEYDKIIKNADDLLDKRTLFTFKNNVQSHIDDFMSKLPKSDELLKLAKKSAKNQGKIPAIKNGILMGATISLLIYLINSKKNNNNQK